MKSLLSLVVFFSSFYSLAHSGNTNSAGCHNDRINGGYHCHKANEYQKNLAPKEQTDEIAADKPASDSKGDVPSLVEI